MREIVTHQIGDKCNARLRVLADHADGPGEAPSFYVVSGALSPCEVQFHTGPVIAGVPLRGVTVEALIAICADRLEQWQKGPLASLDDDMAASALRSALGYLSMRHVDRARRNVVAEAVS